MNYTLEIAQTTKDPKILTEILKEGNDNLLSWYAVENPNCPPEALVEVLKRGEDDDLSRYAVENPNCPPEALVEVLKRGNYDWVSIGAYNNPNCPTEAIIKWMQKIGKIGKEDPTKHIIEYENIKEDDFQDLKDLL